MSYQDNNSMVQSLVDEQYIKTSKIKVVFRIVDRANYFPLKDKGCAYNLRAFKSGNIHISAPNIYGTVMESLKLNPGLSFLNIGSGTGYFSTMVGLLIGNLGVNHGVDVHEDVIEYAQKILKESKENIPVLNSDKFCDPIFVKGNGLCLLSNRNQYDRVYCGAECPENYETYVKNLLKVGGVLVMPFKNKLLRITRVSEVQWQQESLLGVMFATLELPTLADQRNPVQLPETSNPSSPRMSVICENTSTAVKPELIFPSSSSSSSSSPSSSSSNHHSFPFVLAAEEMKNELQENLNKVAERLGSLQEILECPVCYNILDSTLIQCKYGHGICSSCASNIEKCPSCKQEFVVHQSTLLGKILDCLPKPCAFVDNGCTLIALDKDHEAFCKYRPSTCRIALCGWSGCVKDLKGHVKICGKSKVCKISSNTKELQYFPIDKTQNTLFCNPIIFENQLFWEFFNRDANTKRISYRFYHVATSKPTRSYFFKVSFKKGQIEHTICYKALLDGELDKLGDHDETGLIFSNTELEKFQSPKEGGKYEFSLEVITEDDDDLD